MKPRLIYNDDSCTLRTTPPPHTVESISAALDYLKGTQVDCLCWCLGEQVAYSWPSKVIESYFDLMTKGAETIGSFEGGRDVMYGLHRQGIDYLPILIEKAHNQGLTFIGSFRMNDTHLKSYPNSVLAPEFWKTHQQYRLWGVTDGKGYYNAALDYSYPEVRNRYRDSIAEVLNEYDVDGIELDFSRTPYLFQPDEAWGKRDILTDFIREIRALVEQAAPRKERPLTLVLRIPSQERALKTAGIDAHRWIEEKLADILVVSELANNYNQSLAQWRSLCRAAGVLLYPSVEGGPAFNIADFYTTQVRNPQGPRHDGSGAVRLPLDKELRMQRAAAQNLLAQEPDGIYLFNFACRVAEGQNIMHTDPVKLELVTSVLRDVGGLKTLACKGKDYTFYPELPIYVEAGRPRRFHQAIPFAIRGEDIRNAQVTLQFRQIAERNPHADGDFRQSPFVKPGVLRYYLNDREIPEEKLKRTKEPAGRIPSGFLLKRHESIQISLPGHELCDGENTLSFEMPHYPQEHDPYVYIYELDVSVTFA